MPTVAVFRGGTTIEHEQFYTSAEPILDSLQTLRHKQKDIVVTKSGELLVSGKRTNVAKAMHDVDSVLVLLPENCTVRPELESYLNKTSVPAFGQRSAIGSLVRLRNEYKATTQLPDTKTVITFSIKNYRDENTYTFPVLEEIYTQKNLYNTPSWLDPEVHAKIKTSIAELDSEFSPTQLWRTTFFVNDKQVQMKNVSTAPELLFTPAFKTARDFVGMSDTDLLELIINNNV